MKLIGLTGGIATGKSTVSNIIRSLGIPVIDADELAREVVEPGSYGLRAIVQVFGQGILENSQLNRGAMAEKIFNNESQRQIVERITHPLIQWRALQEQEYFKSEERTVVFYDVALLFEKNLKDNFSSVVVVHTTEDNQVLRLGVRDKLSEEEIKKRISAQMGISKKVALADHLIDNNFSLELTKHQVIKLIEKLKT